jgi:hypothetical protein
MRYHRRFLPLLAVPLLAVAAACGDDSPIPEAAATLPPAASTVPPTTGAPAPSTSYDVPTGADEVVISAGYEGGFAPAGAIFARSPLALISGDGRALSTGPVAAIYPGPLLPNILERSITPDAVQRLVAMADRLGLLADVTYARNDQVADASDTVVDITVGGTTYHHQAYALGIDGDETDPARRNLQEFVAALTDLQSTVGAGALGPDQPYLPANYLIQAMEFDPEALDVDVEPTVEAWPTDAPVRLADALECAVLPAAVARPLFDDATTLTFFTDAGVSYSVAAVQQVPGRTC